MGARRVKVVLLDLNEIETMTKTPWYMSSQDPAELSLTIRGMIMMYIPVFIAVLAYFNVPLANSDVADLATSLSAVIATVITLYGLVRKIVNKIKTVV